MGEVVDISGQRPGEPTYTPPGAHRATLGSPLLKETKDAANELGKKAPGFIAAMSALMTQVQRQADAQVKTNHWLKRLYDQNQLQLTAIKVHTDATVAHGKQLDRNSEAQEALKQ